MQFYYGYISGSYLHNKNHVALLNTISKQDIIENTFLRDTEESKFGRFGLDSGWSSTIVDDVDWDLSVVADPVRTMLELLYDRRFDLADVMMQEMFQANVGMQELAIACCDLLMRFDEDGKIFDFLVERIPAFRTTLMQRTAYRLRSEKENKKSLKKKRR